MKKYLSFFLAMLMMVSVLLAACSKAPEKDTPPPQQTAASNPAADMEKRAQEYPYTDYRAHSQFPLSATKEPLRIAVRRDDTYSADWNKTWFWNWMTEKSGLKFEVEQILVSAMADRKNLMFASGNLPDVMIGFSLKTSELVKYGQTEQQLLPINDYVKPDIMPYLSQWFSDYPVWESGSKAPDGKIYSLPCFMAYSPGNSERFFWNKTWLNETGKKIPKTLDEFIDVLYAFKKARPNSYPLGGGAKGDDPRSYILNALGFLGENRNEGSLIALREGKVVIPGGDPLYKEFLKIMKKLYDDQIINPSFFSMEKTAISAMIAEDKTGAVPNHVNLATPAVEKFSQWESGYPLTSQWNSKQQWLAASSLIVGGCVVSADAKNVETIMRWLDFFYGDMGGLYMWNGPAANSDDCMGLTKGFVIREDGSSVYVDVEEKKYETNLIRNYQQMMGFFNVFGNRAHAVGDPKLIAVNIMQKLYGAPIVETKYDLKNPDNYFRNSMQQNMTPYETEDFPYLIYFDDKKEAVVGDLESVIKPYIESESAKFITGIRNINEFDKYMEELKAMSFNTYLKYYQDAWSSKK